MKRNYIGLSTTLHDPSIAIINSKGEVVFAESTERYLQYKRAINMSPDQMFYISKLLKKYVEPGAELVVAHSWSDKASAKIKMALDKLIDIEKHVANIAKLDDLRKFLTEFKFMYSSQLNAFEIASKALNLTIKQTEEYNGLDGCIVKKYDHHLTHAAAACFTSGFSESCCAVIDGFGEERAHNCYLFKNNNLEEIPGITNENFGSLGILYSKICDICGFDYIAGEEWKVMGLAAYGEYDQQAFDLFNSFLYVDGINIKQCAPNKFLYFFENACKLRRKKDDPIIKSANLAYTGQFVFNKILFEFLNNLHNLNISDNLVFTGGCALNSSANGMITEKTGFKKLYIPSAPADDGNSIGAALLAYNEDHINEKRTSRFHSPYLGSRLSDNKIDHLKKFSKFKKMNDYPNDIHKHAARLISEGKIIGWVQGKAEFGPRALGNRSILADPRPNNIKDLINMRVKFREEFRPLAPSILHEFGDEYFENYEESPYMERTLRFKNEVKSKIPGVVHQDGTGRLQTVKKDWNERYYLLIKSFYDLTGIPMVLNTSFNIMGKPIIHSVEDAVAVFITTGLDALIIDDLLIEKED
jgi:carbamoyltransferase